MTQIVLSYSFFFVMTILLSYILNKLEKNPQDKIDLVSAIILAAIPIINIVFAFMLFLWIIFSVLYRFIFCILPSLKKYNYKYLSTKFKGN